MNHVLQAVDAHLTLNAVAEARKFPPQTRLLVDLAMIGTCGQPAQWRKKMAHSAQEVGEWLPERAVGEALEDLSYVLRTATDDQASQELCARSVGAAWRAEHPFRAERPGDPWDVFLPHRGDAESVLALDRARRLPPPPPVALLKRAARIDDVLGGSTVTVKVGLLKSKARYSRSLARALLAVADAKMVSLSGMRERLSSFTEDKLKVTDEAILEAHEWVETSEPKYDSSLTNDVQSLMGQTGLESWARRCTESAITLKAPQREAVCRRVERAAPTIVRALEYVSFYNELARSLRSAEDTAERVAAGEHLPSPTWGALTYEDAMEPVRRFRSRFPDFYPDEADE